MIKQVFKIIFGLVFSYTAFAKDVGSITRSFEFISGLSDFKTQKIMDNHGKIQINTNFSAAENDYTDFSGEWIGKCKFHGSDEYIDGLEMPITIENDAQKIKLCYEGKCSTLEIGKDFGEHKISENGFIDFHYVFSWIDRSVLVFSLTSLNVSTQYFVESSLVRVIFSKEEDKLIINTDYSNLANTKESENDRFVCEYQRT